MATRESTTNTSEQQIRQTAEVPKEIKKLMGVMVGAAALVMGASGLQEYRNANTYMRDRQDFIASMARGDLKSAGADVRDIMATISTEAGMKLAESSNNKEVIETAKRDRAQLLRIDEKMDEARGMQGL